LETQENIVRKQVDTLQQNSEMLIVTVAQTQPGKEVLALARIRMIIDTLRSAPGLTTSRFYRGQGSNNSTYFLMTTWEDEESWLKAQERHNPKHLLLDNREVLATPPEQWVLTYVWGYRRPLAPPTLASAHLVTIPTREIEQVRQNWLRELQQPDLQALLTFGFLARGITDTPTATRIARPGTLINGRELFKQASSLLLAFYSWSNEIERSEFSMNEHYQRLEAMEEQANSARVLLLEAL